MEWRSLLRAVLEWQSLLADVAGSCHATFVCLFVCASPHEAVSLVVADHRKPKNGETHIWLHGSQLALEVARLMGTANYRETFGADWSTGTPLCAATKPAATASATIETMAVDSDDDGASDAVPGLIDIDDEDDSLGDDYVVEDSEDGDNSATGPELINARAALRKIHDDMLGNTAKVA